MGSIRRQNNGYEIAIDINDEPKAKVKRQRIILSLDTKCEKVAMNNMIGLEINAVEDGLKPLKKSISTSSACNKLHNFCHYYCTETDCKSCKVPDFVKYLGLACDLPDKK